MSLSYVQYRDAVLQELQAQLTEEAYLTEIEDRRSVIDNIIMDSHDESGMSRPSPVEVAEEIIEEFNII